MTGNNVETTPGRLSLLDVQEPSSHPGRSTLDRLADALPRHEINLGANERTLSALAGGALIFGASRLERPAALAAVLAGGGMMYRALSGYCPVYAAMGFHSPGSNSRRVVRKRVQLAMESTEAYRFCRMAQNLPRFLSLVQRVETTSSDSALWTFGEHIGTSDLEMWLTEDLPGRRIQWRSHPSLPFAVELTFDFVGNPGDRGTGVTCSWSVAGMAKAPGSVARAAASFVLEKNLRRLKQLVETGEISNTQGQSSARPMEAK